MLRNAFFCACDKLMVSCIFPVARNLSCYGEMCAGESLAGSNHDFGLLRVETEHRVRPQRKLHSDATGFYQASSKVSVWLDPLLPPVVQRLVRHADSAVASPLA